VLIEEFITRLQANCPTLQNRVYGSVELALAQTTSMITPCAFVMCMSESAEENSLMGQGFMQQITAKIGVISLIKNAKDARGQAAHIDLEVTRSAIRAALCNWIPTNAVMPTQFLEGQLLGYDNLTLRWNDVFTSQYYYRNIST
jgi:hypothetical protein